jgi:hypothetical protein
MTYLQSFVQELAETCAAMSAEITKLLYKTCGPLRELRPFDELVRCKGMR